MNLKSKRILTLALTAALAVSLATGGVYAGSKKKMLEAYEDILIEYNGTTLTDADGPLLINNKTYIPLRMLMNYFGDKEIAWDNTNRKVKVNNKQNPMEAMYMAQLATRNAQIADLEKQVKDLKAQLATAKTETASDSLNLTKLKNNLKDDYDNYDKKDISFSLSGDSSKIKMTITIDKSDWDDFTASEKTKFLNKVCSDIWDEASKATVEGTIKDGSKTLDSFTVKANKDVSLDDDDPDFDTMASKMTTKFKKDWTNEDLKLSLDISGSASKITYKVSLDMGTYQDEWDKLSASKKKGLMDDLYDEIKDDYDDATVTGYVYDTKKKENAAKYDGSKLTEY